MNPFKLGIVVACSTTLLFSCAKHENAQDDGLVAPPSPPIQIVKDTYHGVTLEDPYRYMEDLTDPVVTEWFKAHETYTNTLLGQISNRQQLVDKMKDFDKRRDVRILDVKVMENGRYFYLKSTPEDQVGKLFYRDHYEAEEVLLFDPEQVASEGETLAISSFYPSRSGEKIAFEVGKNGKEVGELYVYDVASRKPIVDKIDRIWFSLVSWLEDDSGFTFLRLQTNDLNDKSIELDSKTYLYDLSRPLSDAKEIFSREKYPNLDINPEDFPGITLLPEQNLIVAGLYTVGREQRILTAPLSELENDVINWQWLFDIDDNVHDLVFSSDKLIYKTAKGADNFKLMQLPLSDLDVNNAAELVPEFSDQSITDFKVTSDGLFITTQRNGVEAFLYFVDLESEKLASVTLPLAAGRLSLASSHFEQSDLWVTGMGWTTDSIRYRYDHGKQTFVEEPLSSSAAFPEYSDLVVEEVMIPSHDGVMVPLSLVYKKGLKRDGTNPVLMLGYGAYGISLNPFFGPNILLFTQYGGILAVSHVRGGGELGNAWHKAGFKQTKPNTWKDFIASAEYLIDKQYTSNNKISILGGSAGGILVGRAMTERPDLFQVAVPTVGVLNAVRSETTANGPVNVPEFGTVEIEDEFKALLEMDAYHHISEGEMYPATLITAGMNDPRVSAWEPGKFAAKLAHANASKNPILFLPEFDEGHGAGQSKDSAFNELANIMSFMLWQTGHEEFQMK